MGDFICSVSGRVHGRGSDLTDVGRISVVRISYWIKYWNFDSGPQEKRLSVAADSLPTVEMILPTDKKRKETNRYYRRGKHRSGSRKQNEVDRITKLTMKKERKIPITFREKPLRWGCRCFPVVRSLFFLWIYLQPLITLPPLSISRAPKQTALIHDASSLTTCE